MQVNSASVEQLVCQASVNLGPESSHDIFKRGGLFFFKQGTLQHEE